MPYWGDSIVADKMDYRKDTPLQCTIDGAAVAQSIIFGMFGVRAEFNGDIRIDPHPPTFAPEMKLRNLRLRGHVLDIEVAGTQYTVCNGMNQLRATIGRPIVVRGGKLMMDSQQSSELLNPRN